MMNDERLSQLLRTALPAVDAAAPSRDLWPDVVRRSEARVRITSTDWSVAAIVIVVLVLFPEWFWFLAYHL
jgi:hypothetical protein